MRERLVGAQAKRRSVDHERSVEGGQVIGIGKSTQTGRGVSLKPW